MMEMRVNPDYHQLRIDELELTADFLMKQAEEREAAREERERLREQRKVEQELAADARASTSNAPTPPTPSMRSRPQATTRARPIRAVDDAIAQNDYRAANIRAGYVYVISKRRRLRARRRQDRNDPPSRTHGPSPRTRRRVRPVPVRRARHVLLRRRLEHQLHQVFIERRLNHVNDSREFFFATPAEVRAVLAEKVGNPLEYTEHPEAVQYRQSTGYWPG